MSRFQSTASNSGGNYALPPEGNHPATLIAVIDLGTHEDDYQGRKYDTRKVLLGWELSAEIKADGTPHVVVQDYNFGDKLSAKSTLRKLLEGWRGKVYAEGEPIDPEAALGKPCLLNVGHKKSNKGHDIYVIMSVSQLPKGMTAPRPFATPYSWHFDDGRLNFAPPEWLPYLYGKPVEDKIDIAHELTGVPVKAATAPVPASAPAPSNGVPVGAGVGIGSDDPPF